MPLIYPFCRYHVRAADAERLCCVKAELASPVRRASYYNRDPQNLVRVLDPRALAPISLSAAQLLFVCDRTPGFFLCEAASGEGRSLWLAARLTDCPPKAPSAPVLPEVRCENAAPVIINHKPEPSAAEIARNLANCTPPAAVFEDGGTRYTVKPVHDPQACRGLQAALEHADFIADCEISASAVRILLSREGNAPADFAAGLVMDAPAVL